MTHRDTRLKPRRFLFIVPYKARDLDGIALVGHHLAKTFGHEVCLTNGYGIERKLLRYSPDALVLDHLTWDFKANQARQAKSLGMKVVVLPTEGWAQNLDEAAPRAGKLQGVSGILDCHFTWGDAVRDLLVGQHVTAPDVTHTIGCPRFDFYREPYVKLMGTRAAFANSLRIADASAPLILWSTNTSYVSRNQRVMLRRQVVKAKLPEAEVRAMLRDGQVQFREHSEAVVTLARRHPEWNIVVKVHPAEWINPYLELQKRAPNLYLAFDEPIFRFVYHCDVVLQRGCTTATEAWMCGKPVLELEMGRYENETRGDFRAGNEVVSSVDEAEAAIRGYLGGREVGAGQLEARAKFIATFFYRVDGKSSERCASMLHELLSPPGYTDEDQASTQASVRNAAEEWKRHEDSRPVNRLKDLFGISRETSLRWWRRVLSGEEKDNQGLFVPESEITPQMVDELYKRFESVLGNGSA